MFPRRMLLLHLVLPAFALAACALPARPGMPAGAAAPLSALPTALPGIGKAPAGEVLLTADALPRGFQLVGAAGQDVHPGPGRSSAASRFTSGTGAAGRRLYLRVSQFAAVGVANVDFNAEKGDIGRSSTALPPGSTKVGDVWLAYSVASGAGSSATSSVGLLLRERNYLCSAVLTGPNGSVQLADLVPLAQRQVARLATAR